jgi:hypothetical protein
MDAPFRNHWNEFAPAALAASITLPPEQKVVGPLTLTVGAAGAGSGVTEVGALAAEEQPLAFVLVTA